MPLIDLVPPVDLVLLMLPVDLMVVLPVDLLPGELLLVVVLVTCLQSTHGQPAAD